MFTEHLADKLAKYPKIASSVEWLMRSNAVRGILAKQLVAYILSAVLLGTGATGMSYEDTPVLFILERLSDTNILSASLAESLIGIIGNVLSDSEEAFIDDSFATALTSDPEILKGILSGAVDHLVTGIKIPEGTFPDLQTGVQAANGLGTLNALSTAARFFNYSGEARRRFSAKAKAELDAAAEAANSANAAVAQTPSQKIEALNDAMRATAGATKANIERSLSGDSQYTYEPPPNSELLLADYEKVRPEDSFSLIGLFTAVRNVDELKMLNILIDEDLRLMPDDQAFKNIVAIEAGQEAAISAEPTSEDIAMVKSLKALGAALNAKPAQTAP
jgi:hypothetical protein